MVDALCDTGAAVSCVDPDRVNLKSSDHWNTTTVICSIMGFNSLVVCLLGSVKATVFIQTIPF